MLEGGDATFKSKTCTLRDRDAVNNRSDSPSEGGELTMNFKDYPTLDFLDTEGNEELGYDDEMSEIAAAGTSYTDDSVKVYMREMGKFQLLDKKREVELAKRIEEGHRAAHEATFGTALAITEIRKLLYKIVTAKKRASDIIDMACFQ